MFSGPIAIFGRLGVWLTTSRTGQIVLALCTLGLGVRLVYNAGRKNERAAADLRNLETEKELSDAQGKALADAPRGKPAVVERLRDTGL